MKRIYSIDFTRGVVMIIMALDHIRDLMHINSAMQNPTDLATTTPAIFFTRWITHFCAPVFVFLAGTSAYLAFRNKNDVSQSMKFLLKRGLWLVLVEFTVVNLGLFFDAGFHTLIFEVIATIGFGFIILSLLLKLSSKTIGIIGLAIMLLHDLVSLIPMGQSSVILTVLTPFFAPAAFPFANHVFVMAYPPIPWLGIMLTGFGAGKLFELSESKRKSLFLKIGLGALALFIIIRFINIYGDPAPWSHQRTTVYTFLSFMNITKYPPSLIFCLVTLGVMFLILAIGEQVKNKITDVAFVYGKVPLFYFVVHFYIIHTLLITLLFLQGFHWADMNFASGAFGRPKGVQNGLPLWGVYLVWLAVVTALYRPCVWFGQYKARHKYWWLSYV
jgi:uncharacterized membrane protein